MVTVPVPVCSVHHGYYVDDWNCYLEDLDGACTKDTAHVVCWRKNGHSLNIDLTACMRKDSKAVEYFWETGDSSVFDAQKQEATSKRRDRVTRVERVWHD